MAITEDDHSKDYIKVTPKQALGWGGGVIAVGSLVAILNGLTSVKGFVFTREEGTALERRVTATEQAQKEFLVRIERLADSVDRKMNDNRKELSESIEKSNDRVLLRMSDMADRLIKKIDSQNEKLESQIRGLKKTK